ncbi:MAG: hypothetical protein GX306_10550 [Clostridiales bacterium]|jgi:hypothetical protein|nr:hypothetical protein [Clostridiales bacterium]
MSLFHSLFAKFRRKEQDQNHSDYRESIVSPEEVLPDSIDHPRDINNETNEEYEIVEIEILPAKRICPDCGGITLEGLEFCDKCGGELQ